MDDKLKKIIKGLPVIDEVKDLLISKIDIIDKKMLIGILEKYSVKKNKLINNNDNNILLKKQIYGLDMLISDNYDKVYIEKLLEELN